MSKTQRERELECVIADLKAECQALRAAKPAQQELVTKIISNLEPLLAAKNQSWAYAEKMLLDLLAAATQPAQQEPVIVNAVLLDACKRARLAMAAASQGDANFLSEYQRLDAVISKAEGHQK